MKSNTRFNQNKRGIECLNCHQPLSQIDNFCSNCGQVNDLKPLSIKQYITEFFSGFFAFDTRTLNTIIPLLFKPGKVTNEYVHGERMKYVNPFQLYLHTSIIFFLVTGIFMTLDKYDAISNNHSIENIKNTKKADSIKNEVSKNLQKTSEKLKKQELNINLDFINSNKEKKDSIKEKPIQINSISQLINNQVDTVFRTTKFIKIVKDTSISRDDKDDIIKNLFNKHISNAYSKIYINQDIKLDSLQNFEKFKEVFFKQTEAKLKKQKIDYRFSEFIKTSEDDQTINNLVGNNLFKKISIFNKCKTNNVGNALDSLGYPKTRKNIFIFNKSKDINKFKKDATFRREYLNNMISKTSIVLFFMLPLVTLFLKLLYIRRKVNFTEHLIFTFHAQTAFFIIFLIFMILDRYLKTDIGIPIFIILFMVYLFIAMRRYYKQGFFKTFIKYMLLNLGYLFLSIFGSLVVAFLAFVM